MRTLRLARVAAEAEGLRLRRMAQRMAVRVAMGLVAAVFLLGTLTFLHVLVWFWLRLDHDVSPIWTAVILAGIDLVIAAVLLFLASRSAPSRIEEQALEVRTRALRDARGSLALSAMVMPIIRLLLNRRRR